MSSRELEIFRGDLANPEAVSGAVAGRDVVFHLGALIPIPYSYLHPREFVTANVSGTLNVLEAARRGEVQRVVHTSTSEVYGTAQEIPITEEHPLHPQSPYAATKVAADQLALTYQRSFGTPVAIVRPFNTFGPRQSARAVIPTIITQALSRETIELGATDTTRDFLYVGDTVAGIMRVAQRRRGRRRGDQPRHRCRGIDRRGRPSVCSSFFNSTSRWTSTTIAFDRPTARSNDLWPRSPRRRSCSAGRPRPTSMRDCS